MQLLYNVKNIAKLLIKLAWSLLQAEIEWNAK